MTVDTGGKFGENFKMKRGRMLGRGVTRFGDQGKNKESPSLECGSLFVLVAGCILLFGLKEKQIF